MQSAKVDFFENETTISLVRLPERDESNVKEEEVYLKSSIANKSDFYIETSSLNAYLLIGLDQRVMKLMIITMLGFPTQHFFQTSFYSVPKSKLKGVLKLSFS